MKINKNDLARIGQATKQVERARRTTAPRRRPPSNWAGGMWYYTTTPVTAASRSGTTRANSKLNMGGGSGVPCLVDSSGNPYPHPTAPTVPLTCGAIPTTPPTVAADRLVFAIPWNGHMMIIFVAACT